MIKALIDSALVLESLNATSKDDVLPEMLATACEAGVVASSDQDSVLKSLREREALGSTGIGNGVAVPHVKNVIDKPCMVVARADAGIAYQSVDGRDVNLFFMILGSKDDPETHLQILRWISNLARNKDFRRFAASVKDAEGLRELLVEMSEV